LINLSSFGWGTGSSPIVVVLEFGDEGSFHGLGNWIRPERLARSAAD
jgi:hypothetical protein